MSRHKPLPKLKEDISPNVVPMIDIMFLLLLFFMLGADMSQREAVEIPLPKADQIKEAKQHEDSPTAIVNVHPDGLANAALFESPAASRDPQLWKVSMRGIEYTWDELKTQLKIEADEYPEDSADAVAGRVLSKKRLLIRADKSAPFGMIQRVIETAGSVGLYRVEVAGSKPVAAGT
jgi:biopolymer transport protein ExbD